MQQIHWKSSARSGELMTKEYSMPCGCKVLLLLELSQKEGGARRADHFFELAASLCFSMLEAECPHFVAWYDEKEGQIRRHAVKKEQDLYEMLDLLMRTSFYKQEYDVKAAYFSSYPKGTYSTVLILDKEGNLQRDEEDTVTFGEEELKESLSGFVLEV